MWFRRYCPDKHSLTFWTCCDLDLQPSNPIFQQDTLAYDAVLSNKFGCKPTSSLEDTTEIVIFWLYKPLLWPWFWTQWTKFSARHSGIWCYTTISGLATKCSVVQKILSGQTFTNILNLCCDCDLERSNPIFPQDTDLWCTFKASLVAKGPAV